MDKVSQSFNHLKSTYDSGRTLPETWRKEQLERFMKMISENQNDILDAIRQDTGISKEEVYVTEFGIVMQQCEYLLKKLHSFLQPKNIRTPMMQRPSVAYKMYQPMGLVLISCPLNYPINYWLVPLAGALASGNCVLIYNYGLEMMNNFSHLMVSLLTRYLDTSAVVYMTQLVEETFNVYDKPWNKILFIGHSDMGRKVQAIASNYFTEVNYMHDVKCPVIVDQTCDLEVTAKRIIWGKYLRCGQNCLSPDYILIQRSIEDRFIAECRKVLVEFYGNDPFTSTNYSRISSSHHFNRLINLLNDCGKIVVGGTYNERERYFSPTLVSEVNIDSALMKEPIMGPILPIIPYDTLDDAISFYNRQPSPSVLYLFANDKYVQDKIVLNTISGSCVINDVLVQLAIEELPYGGSRESGIGSFNGKDSFTTFSYCKSVMHKATWTDPQLRYPPYEANNDAKAICSL